MEDDGTGEKVDGNSMSMAEKRVERAQSGRHRRGRSKWTKGELHWGGVPLSRSPIGAQNVSEGAAISEGEALGLKAGGGYRYFIPDLEVQSPFFDPVGRRVGRRGIVRNFATDDS